MLKLSTDARLVVAAVLAALASLLAAGVVPSPWDAVVTALVAGLGTLTAVKADDTDGAGV